MSLMRSVLYVPGNTERMIRKAPTIPADIITLDLEDAVPPNQKPVARQMVRDHIGFAGRGGSLVYVRVNDWGTGQTGDDLETVLCEGLDGITLPKCRRPEDVVRLDRTLEDLERRYGLVVGSIRVSILLETADGIINASACCRASERVASAIFGCVDYTTDMGVTLTQQEDEQEYARRHVAVAAHAAGIVAIDGPFVWFREMAAFEASVRHGKSMGYEGKMLDHPSQVEVSNRLYAPGPDEVGWANEVVRVFEEEALTRGTAAASYQGRMIDTPVYNNALNTLKRRDEVVAQQRRVSRMQSAARD